MAHVRVWVVSLRALHLLSTVQVRLIGGCKLRAGVYVRVNGCLSLYVSPVMNWGLRVYPTLTQCQLGLAPTPLQPCKGWMNKKIKKRTSQVNSKLRLKFRIKFFHIVRFKFKKFKTSSHLMIICWASHSNFWCSEQKLLTCNSKLWTHK